MNAAVKARHKDGKTQAYKQAFATLASRPLGHKHFEQVKTDLRNEKALGLIEVWNTLDDEFPDNLKHRTLFHRRLHLAPSVALNGTYLPHTESLVMRQNEVSYSGRVLPVLFNSEHIEHRYIQRTATLATYENSRFAATLVIGTILADFCGRLTTPEGEVLNYPFMLPDPKGLYLGFSHGYRGNPFDPHLRMKCIRPELGSAKPAFYAYGDGTPNPRLPADPPSPAACLSVNTFIGMAEISARQRKVWNRFQEAIPAVLEDGFIEEFVIDYANGMLGNSKSPFTQRFNRVAEAVFSIAVSQEWRDSALKSVTALQRQKHAGPNGPA